MRPVCTRRRMRPADSVEPATQIDRAVDQVAVDGAVDVGEDARDGAGQVHDAVDDVLVEPRQRARQARPSRARTVAW